MITAADIANMKECSENTMLDTCTIDTQAAGTGKNPTGGAFTSSDAISCGFNASASDEVFDGSQQTITDAKIRLPADTVASSKNQITITKRFGVAISPVQHFAILGEPKLTPSELVCNCRRVTRGSVR